MTFEIRPGRAPQGARKLVTERRYYFELVAQGYSSREACRIVGVNPKTGREWRNGPSKRNGKRPPLLPTEVAVGAVLSSRFLSEEERVVIADGRRLGWTLRRIAEALGRSPSTIS